MTLKINSKELPLSSTFLSYSSERRELVGSGINGLEFYSLDTDSLRTIGLELRAVLDGVVCSGAGIVVLASFPLQEELSAELRGQVESIRDSYRQTMSPSDFESYWADFGHFWPMWLSGRSSRKLLSISRDSWKVLAVKDSETYEGLYRSECTDLALLIGEDDDLNLSRINAASLDVLWKTTVKNAGAYSIDTSGSCCSVLSGNEIISIGMGDGIVNRREPIPVDSDVNLWGALTEVETGFYLAGYTGGPTGMKICQTRTGQPQATPVFVSSGIELFKTIPLVAKYKARECRCCDFCLSRLVWVPEVSRLVLHASISTDPAGGGDEMANGIFAVDPITGACETCLITDECSTGTLSCLGDGKLLYSGDNGDFLITLNEQA